VITQRAVSLSRSLMARAFFALILSLVLTIPTAAPALAEGMQNLRKYAGIVVDAKSGQVLYEEAADSKRYPASVSKVMTLYILFQELAAGNMKLSTKMTVSKYAASAVPTKLGLKAGSTITVENAIGAIVTLSANDMARVIAEHISGSEAKFAERMTATAQALGMNRTSYRNASGLPDPGQLTTVRDQAILGVAIYEHFPKYYEFFQTRSFSYGKRTYGNHNRLLGENGIDGIKTGYINAAGSNLLTAARKDGRHIVVVGFGFNSSGARDAKVRELVSKFLPKGRQGSYLQTAMIPQPGRHSKAAPASIQVATADQPVFVVPMPLPSFRLNGAMQGETQLAAYAPQPQAAPSAIAAKVNVALEAPAVELQPAVRAANVLGAPSAMPQPPERAPDVIGQWISDTLGAPPAALGQTAPSAPLVPPVGVGDKGQPIDLMTSGATGAGKPTQLASAQPIVPPLSPADAKAPGWIVQIGAAPTQDGANQLLANATGRLGALDNFRSYVERFEKNGQTYYRARFGGFGGRDDATSTCNQLKKEKLSCLALQS